MNGSQESMNRHTNRVHWATTIAMAAGLAVNFVHTFVSTTTTNNKVASIEDKTDVNSEQIDDVAKETAKGIDQFDDRVNDQIASSEEKIKEAELKFEKFQERIDAALGEMETIVSKLEEQREELKLKLADGLKQIAETENRVYAKLNMDEASRKLDSLTIEAMAESTRAEFEFLLGTARHQPVLNNGSAIWKPHATSAPVSLESLQNAQVLRDEVQFVHLLKSDFVDRVRPNLPPNNDPEFNREQGSFINAQRNTSLFG